MGRACLSQNPLQDVRDFNHLLVRVVRQHEVDDHRGHAPVPGHQAPGDIGIAQRDGPDALKGGRVHGQGILHQRRHHQVVAVRLAVTVVGQRRDPTRIRQLPDRLGQRLDRIQRSGLEHRALLHGHRDQQVVGLRVGGLQRIEGHELGVVIAEQDAVVVGDREKLRTGRHRKHDQGGQAHDPPAIVQQGGRVAVKQAHGAYQSPDLDEYTWSGNL